jgi:hypothetical protein
LSGSEDEAAEADEGEEGEEGEEADEGEEAKEWRERDSQDFRQEGYLANFASESCKTKHSSSIAQLFIAISLLEVPFGHLLYCQ